MRFFCPPATDVIRAPVAVPALCQRAQIFSSSLLTSSSPPLSLSLSPFSPHDVHVAHVRYSRCEHDTSHRARTHIAPWTPQFTPVRPFGSTASINVRKKNDNVVFGKACGPPGRPGAGPYPSAAVLHGRTYAKRRGGGRASGLRAGASLPFSKVIKRTRVNDYREYVSL